MFEKTMNALEKYQLVLEHETCICEKPACHVDCYCNDCCCGRCGRCWNLMDVKVAIEELFQNNRDYFEFDIAAKTPRPDQYYPDSDRPTQVSHISDTWADWMEERVQELEEMLMLHMAKERTS